MAGIDLCVDLTSPSASADSGAAGELQQGAAEAGSGAAAAAGITGGTVDLSTDTPIYIDLQGCIDLTADGDGATDAVSAHAMIARAHPPSEERVSKGSSIYTELTDFGSSLTGLFLTDAAWDSPQGLSSALQSAFDRTIIDISGAQAADESAQAGADVLWQQRRDVHAFLKRAAGQLEIEKMDPNPASQPGTPMYARFKASLDSCEDKSIKLVFHGTPEANVDAIMKSGLDPARRRGQVYGAGEYFGTDAGTSLSYSQGGRCMLVFAVLLDSSGITHHQEGGLIIAGPQAAAPRLKDGESGPGMVVVNRIENQLPLFSIRYTVKRGVPAARQPLAPPPRPNYGAGRGRKAMRKKAAAPKRKYAPAAPPPAPKTSWTEDETNALVEATRKAVLERRKKKKEAAAAAAAN